jgi:hypothetical protein
MSNPVRGDGGKFQGSVGGGKDRVPTPGMLPRPRHTENAESTTPDYEALHKRLAAARKGDEVAAAAQVSAAVAAPTPNSLPSHPARRNGSSSRRTPGGWHLSAHVVKQARDKGVDLAAVAECVDNPSTSYPSGRYPGQERRIRGDICVVVDPAAKKAITVYLDRVETDLRKDQRNDSDALEYERRRKSR